MDTEPKIVGRENRPHMNALLHRTFWVRTPRSDAIALDDANASNVVREARHFAGGSLVDRSEAYCHSSSATGGSDVGRRSSPHHAAGDGYRTGEGVLRKEGRRHRR